MHYTILTVAPDTTITFHPSSIILEEEGERLVPGVLSENLSFLHFGTVFPVVF